MIDLDHFDFTSSDRHLVARIHDFKLDRWIFPGRQFRKIRPDHPVEDMRLERLNGFFLCVDDNRLVVNAKHAVRQQRQTDDMVHVRMGQEYVTNPGHLIERQIAQTGACVYQQIIIDQEGSGSQVRTYATGPSEYFNLHTAFLLSCTTFREASNTWTSL